MCQKYIIVYHGCLSKGEGERLPSCRPMLSQVREYINSDGWHICELTGTEKLCKGSKESAPVETYTFVEPYCSDSCEKFHKGIDTVEGNKDRLGYAAERVVEGEFPVVASFGHLRVDTERVMLLYKSLIGHANNAAEGVTSKVDFPITESYPARQAVLFLSSPKLQAGHPIMASFPSLELEEKVQILQRIMGTLTIASSALRTLSCQSSILFEAKGTRDDEQWQAYAHTIDPVDLPTAPSKPVSEAQTRLLSMIETLTADGEAWGVSQEYKTSACSLLEQECELAEEEIQRLIHENLENGTLVFEAPRRGELKRAESLFKGIDADPTNPYPPHCWETSTLEGGGRSEAEST